MLTLKIYISFSETMVKDKRKTNIYNFKEADVFNFKELFDNDSGNIDMAFELFNHKQSINTYRQVMSLLSKISKCFANPNQSTTFLILEKKRWQILLPILLKPCLRANLFSTRWSQPCLGWKPWEELKSTDQLLLQG